MQDSLSDFWIKFWGVRGSVASPGEQTVKYGGNTSCIEMRCGEHRLIFDAGTGLKVLGDNLNLQEQLDYNIFLSHSHMDHVCGFPFFRPAYLPNSRLTLWAGHLKPQQMSVEGMIRNMMDQPFFPITVDLLAASLTFRDFTAGETLYLGTDISIQTASLNHPGGATGYRVNYNNCAVCYVTDTEHVPNKPNQAILDLIQDADVLIYDSTYTDAEFPEHVGWGHSTWQEGARLAKMAGVKQFFVFHHDPSRTDDMLDMISAELPKHHSHAQIAREGLTVHIQKTL